MMSVIGMESMVTRARLRYTRDYLAPGMCSLIKPAAIETLTQFPAKIKTVVLYCPINNSTVMTFNGGDHIFYLCIR